MYSTACLNLDSSMSSAIIIEILLFYSANHNDSPSCFMHRLYALREITARERVSNSISLTKQDDLFIHKKQQLVLQKSA